VAQEETPTTLSPAEIEVLQAGSEVYATQCAGCHQPTGAGIPGQFPPLVGNPNVADAAYVAGVIRNGRQGEIVVNDVTYNGVMPAFATLSDDEVDAVVAFVQAGLVVPGAPVEEGESLPLAGTSLPPLASLAVGAAFLLALAVAALVLGPRVVGSVDRLSLSWLDAWMKTAVIVVGIVVATVVVPSVVMKTETVGRLPRLTQDLIGSGLWAGGLAVGLGALWWARRENRV
jgi:mono/diheme cytochrome c family protein